MHLPKGSMCAWSSGKCCCLLLGVMMDNTLQGFLTISRVPLAHALASVLWQRSPLKIRGISSKLDQHPL